ncbi:MAG: hypothetical protein CMQ46_13925 [Gammaproteobacteria bacterium]|nr:hypothetical protein [Gammaproteobacteria bacterium]MBJ56349.1 hypothetical protein [Gammaproteobacteria bacterium]HBN16309.1 hypothetical protein [Pseudohongiella sp.]|tara:strand:- start:1964 stop:2359 length:396 start_codon:yes stop_codon:yes gene_type:complete
MIHPVLTNIDQVIGQIGPQIEVIGERSSRANLLRDIVDACRNKKAFLFTIIGDDSFAVLRPMPQRVVQVWVAYSRAGNATEQYLPAIKDLCRSVGATQIEFETALESVERLMPRFGWKKAYTVWRLKIDET